MKEKSTVKKVLLSLYHYFCFFLLMAFLITCCMLLFLNTMSHSMGIEFTRENIKIAAGLTFGNVVLLSAICTLIDALRRKFTIDRPVKEIVAAAEKIAKGDYSVRIPRIHSINRADGLEEIVDCYNKWQRSFAVSK
jgi:nitrogen fixation/metabolism regulation signal transduction histidine kinase